MKFIYILLIIIFSANLTETSFAKGLNSLSAKDADKTKAKTKAGKSLKEEMNEVKASISDDHAKFDGNLTVATSFGWIGLTKDSETWRASGMSDITVSYKLPMKIMNFDFFATFRYAPMDVAPNLTIENEKREFVGVVDAYYGGGSILIPVSTKLTALASAEIGYLLPYLDDQLGSKKDNSPEDNGINVTFGGGIDYSLLPGLKFGPRLYVGAGTFTSYQMSGNATFAF